MARADRLPAHRLAAPEAIHWGRALSWAFYDFANTIYSALVVSYAITLHVKEYTGVEKYTFLTMGLSLLASALLLPVAGEIADRTGRAKRWLMALTVSCCAACALITFAGGPWLILTLFFVANFCYTVSLTLYNSLMPMLAPRRRLGLLSGLGVGMGYAGVAFALPLGWMVVGFYKNWRPAHELAPLFALAGALFLLFSLPLFLFVPERPPGKGTRPGVKLGRLALRRTLATIRLLPRNRRILLFLVGNFCLVDSLNAGIIAASPYMVHVFGLQKQQAMLWLIPFSIGAAALGAIGGRIADAVGARRALLAAGVSVMFALLICGMTQSFALFIIVFTLLGGFGLANIWVAGRKFLIELVPPGQLGKHFGLYNVSQKLSMIGVIVFGILADLTLPGIPGGGYRLGLLSLMFMLTVGLTCIYKVKTGEWSAA